jgi:endo-1,4-beta-D-glucanase Y
MKKNGLPVLLCVTVLFSASCTPDFLKSIENPSKNDAPKKESLKLNADTKPKLLAVTYISSEEFNSKIIYFATQALKKYVVGPNTDPSKLAKSGELRVLVDPNKQTTINQMSLAMLIAVTLDTQDKTIELNGEMLTLQEVFARLENFHKRFLLEKSPLMSWSVDEKGIAQKGGGFVGEQTRAYALVLAAKKWGLQSEEYIKSAKDTLDFISSQSMMKVSDGAVSRTILKAGEKWGSNKKGEVYCDFGGGQSPGLHKYFSSFTKNKQWSENAESVYWVLKNFNALKVNFDSNGLRTGLFPNFMMTNGKKAFDSEREYYDELDSTVATFRLALDYQWYGEKRAKNFLKDQTKWAISYYGKEKISYDKSYHQFELNGSPKPSKEGKLYSSTTRALGFAIAGQVNPEVSGAQKLLNEAVEMTLEKPLTTSFHDLSATLQLLVIQGKFIHPEN